MIYSRFNKSRLAQRMGCCLNESNPECLVLPMLSGSIPRHYVFPRNQKKAVVLHHEHPVPLYSNWFGGSPRIRSSSGVRRESILRSHSTVVLSCVSTYGYRTTSGLLRQFSVCGQVLFNFSKGCETSKQTKLLTFSIFFFSKTKVLLNYFEQKYLWVKGTNFTLLYSMDMPASNGR